MIGVVLVSTFRNPKKKSLGWPSPGSDTKTKASGRENYFPPRRLLCCFIRGDGN